MIIELFHLKINLSGLVLGSFTFLMIMSGRYSCIAGEYYFSKRLWILFLLIGIISLPVSLLLKNLFLSAMISITGFTYLWGINEIIKQEERVKKGWFPENPRKKMKKK